GDVVLSSAHADPPPSFPLLYTDPAPPDIDTLSLHDALPISQPPRSASRRRAGSGSDCSPCKSTAWPAPSISPRRRPPSRKPGRRSEEHTSELQLRENLVCRLLLEKKKNRERRTRDRPA